MDRASDDGARERRLEEALKESEERFRRLVEAAKDYAIFMVDADGGVITWNEGAQRVFGYEEEEILGEDGSSLFTPEDRSSGAPERELKKAQTEGRAEAERWHVRKDGSRFWASDFVRPIRNERGNLLGLSKVARATSRSASGPRMRLPRCGRPSESVSPATCTTWRCRTSSLPCRRPRHTGSLAERIRKKASRN
jgi:PAS domain S-box-containing protein